ncbi:MAG: fasciclin domain-containing protein [Bacteroidota bacterium]
MKQFYLLAIALLISSGLSAQVFVDADATGAGDGSSWADAYTTLADAVAGAAEGDQIWIADGTYAHDATIIIDKSLIILGGFNGTETTFDQADPLTNTVILSGDVDGDDDPNDITLNRDDNIDILEVDSLLAPLGEDLPAVIMDGLNFVSGENAQLPDDTPIDDFAGAAVLAYSPTGLANVTFSGCSSDIGAGVAFLGTGANGSFVDGVVAQGNVSASTGIIYMNTIIGVTVNNGLFTQNVTLRGAVYANNALSIFTNNCTFEDNTNTGGRGLGVTYINVYPGVITNSDFINNTGGNGAAVYLIGDDAEPADPNNTFISDCNFIGNTSASFGGAILNLSADYTLNNCTFEGNSITSGSGAATYAQGDVRAVVIDSCVFRDNVGPNGAVLVRDSATVGTITYSTFENNGDPSLTNRGAGVTAFGRFTAAEDPVIFRGMPSVTIDYCTFINNAVEDQDPTLGLGGAVYMGGDFVSGTLNISNSDFLGNTAGSGWGGAVFPLFGVNTTIDNCYFEGNSADQGAAVGSFNSWSTDERQNPGEERDPASVMISNSQFNQNAAREQAGAVIAFGVDQTIYNSQFFGNLVLEDEIGVGGAIGLNGDSAYVATFDLFNNTFVGNLAATEGDNITLFQNALDPVGTTTTLNITNNAFFTLSGLGNVIVETDAVGDIVSGGGNFFNEETDIMGMDIIDDGAVEEDFYIEAIEYGRNEINLTPFPTSVMVDGGVAGPGIPTTDINGAMRDAMPDIGSVEIAAGTVVDIAVGSPVHTALVGALTAADLVTPLQGEGPFTVFAPTDDAFAAVDATTLAIIQANVMEALAPTLLYHVISGEFVTSRNIINGDVTSGTTMQGQDLAFNFDGTTVSITHDAGVANIIVPDLVARNGIVHVIDQVMVPQPVIDFVVGTEDISASGLEISFFPNPVQEELHINATDVRIQDLQVGLINMNGQRLGQYQFGNGQHRIDVAQLPAGAYTLELTIDGEVYSTQILKK